MIVSMNPNQACRRCGRAMTAKDATVRLPGWAPTKVRIYRCVPCLGDVRKGILREYPRASA